MEVVDFDLSEEEWRKRYDRLFVACPRAFIQQSTAWAVLVTSVGPDRPIFLLALDKGREAGGLPLYLCPGKAGPIMTSVPQAGPLGGIFCRADADAELVYAALIGKADELAREHGCIALSVITNPLNADVDLYRQYLKPDVTFENFTQLVPIPKAVHGSELIIKNNKKGNPAATIRKAEAAGFTTRLGESADDLTRWYEIHAERAAEIGIAPLDRRLIETLWDELAPKGGAMLQLVMAGDDIAAGALLVLHREVADVFAISMAARYAAEAPNYLAFKAALIELARRKVTVMNWQSSPRRRDGVYRFKRQWGSLEHVYYYVTKVYAPEDAILALGREGVVREYPGHFVVPFGVFDAGRIGGSYAKP